MLQKCLEKLLPTDILSIHLSLLLNLRRKMRRSRELIVLVVKVSLN